MAMMKGRIFAFGIVSFLVLAGWGWYVLNDWVHHGWWRYHPICFSGDVPYDEMLNPMKPDVRENVYSALEERFPGGTFRDGNAMYIRPYIALFQIPERRNFLFSVSEEVSGEILTICREYRHIFTNDTEEVTKPLPPEWLIDIMQFLTFYPRLDK